MTWLLGNRLKIDRRDGVTTIGWGHVGVVEIFGWVLVPMMTAWGIASALGRDMVLGMRVIPMNSLATVIYWSGLALLVLHLAFNRRVELTSADDRISYQFRRFPGVRRTWPREHLAAVLVSTREDPLAESPAGIQRVENTQLRVRVHGASDLVIRGLSDDDARQVKAHLEQTI